MSSSAQNRVVNLSMPYTGTIGIFLFMLFMILN